MFSDCSISDIDSGEDSDTFYAAMDYSTSAPEPTALPPPPTSWLFGGPGGPSAAPVMPPPPSAAAPAAVLAQPSSAGVQGDVLSKNLKDLLNIGH